MLRKEIVMRMLPACSRTGSRSFRSFGIRCTLLESHFRNIGAALREELRSRSPGLIPPSVLVEMISACTTCTTVLYSALKLQITCFPTKTGSPVQNLTHK